MNVPYSIYDSSTGAILEQHVGIPPASVASGKGLYVGVTDYAAQRVNPTTGIPVRRNPMPGSADKNVVSADGVDVVTISALPAGVEVSIGQTSYGVVSSPPLSMTFDAPGQYRVMLSHPSFQKREVVIDAA